MTKNLIWKTLAPLMLLPLMACGQTPASNSSATTKAVPVEGDVAKSLTQKLEKAYEKQQLKVISVQGTPIKGIYEVLVSGNQIVYVDSDAN